MILMSYLSSLTFNSLICKMTILILEAVLRSEFRRVSETCFLVVSLNKYLVDSFLLNCLSPCFLFFQFSSLLVLFKFYINYVDIYYIPLILIHISPNLTSFWYFVLSLEDNDTCTILKKIVITYYMKYNFYASLPGAPNLEEQNNISLWKYAFIFSLSLY